MIRVTSRVEFGIYATNIFIWRHLIQFPNQDLEPSSCFSCLSKKEEPVLSLIQASSNLVFTHTQVTDLSKSLGCHRLQQSSRPPKGWRNFAMGLPLSNFISLTKNPKACIVPKSPKVLYCPNRSPRVLDSLHCAQSPIGPLKKSFYWAFGSGSSNWRNQIKVLPPSTGGVSERGEWWLERSKGRWGIPWEMERASFTRLTFVPSPFCWHVQGINLKT